MITHRSGALECQERQKELGAFPSFAPGRTKGKKSKNAKMAIVGVIYGLRRTPEGLEGPLGKRLVATFESHEALFAWLEREARKRGYGTKQTVFWADGSEHIWRLKRKYFPDAEVCLDWYHVVEKLWTAGECLHGEGSQELKEWVERQVKRLRRSAVGSILSELRQLLADTPTTGPGNKGRRQRLAQGDCLLREPPHSHAVRADAQAGPAHRRAPWKEPCATSWACASTDQGCAGVANARNACSTCAASCSTASGGTSPSTSPGRPASRCRPSPNRFARTTPSAAPLNRPQMSNLASS